MNVDEWKKQLNDMISEVEVKIKDFIAHCELIDSVDLNGTDKDELESLAMLKINKLIKVISDL